MPELDFSLPHSKHVLPNGLEVVLHRDTSAPVVAVYVYYHVGSSREEPGKSGFAHLFEHMLFQGSEHVPDNDHFRRIQQAGGTLNGTTNQDRTNYFETLPSNQLELALWLESDRMGFLLPAMTQEKLDNQRDVVRNERRQSYENRPYGLVHETTLGLLYAAGHPYSWPTIGSMVDIGNATLEDVTSFFRRWYGAGNVTLAIGGDFDPEHALALVERYFGGIARGPAVDTPTAARVRFDPADDDARRAILEDDVQVPQLTLAWPTVEAWHPDEAALTLLADVLSANRSSILDAALTIDEELANLVTISHAARERAGDLTIHLRPRPGVSLERLESRVDELVRGFVSGAQADGELAGRVARLEVRREGGLVRGLEPVANRTNQLAFDNCFGGEPDRVRARLERLRAVTADDLRRVAQHYLLDGGRAVVSVVPRGQRGLARDATRAAASSPRPDALDRTSAPLPSAPAQFRSPVLWTESSLRVPCAGTPVDSVPLSTFSLALPGGRLREPVERAGLTMLTAAMLDEGTAALPGTELIDALDGMGAVLAVRANDDDLVLSMSVLDAHLEPAVRLFTQLIAEPRFDAEDFERVRRQQIATAVSRLDAPASVARDVYARRIYGDNIRGAAVLGTRASLEAIEVEDVRAFFADRRIANGARLSFAGARTGASVAELFAGVGAVLTGDVAPSEHDASIRAQTPPDVTTIYLVDRPGAQLSELRIGHPGISRHDDDWFGAYTMNSLLGGSFTSRLNLNLREDKGYTYGVRSEFSGGHTAGSFTVSTAVQTDVTADAVREALGELVRFPGDVREDEVQFARESIAQSLRRAFESASSRLSFVETVQKYGWPTDYPERRLAWLDALTRDTVNDLSQRLLAPERLVVVVVGDAAKIADGLAALAPLVSIGADGVPLAALASRG